MCSTYCAIRLIMSGAAEPPSRRYSSISKRTTCRPAGSPEYHAKCMEHPSRRYQFLGHDIYHGMPFPSADFQNISLQWNQFTKGLGAPFPIYTDTALGSSSKDTKPR